MGIEESETMGRAYRLMQEEELAKKAKGEFLPYKLTDGTCRVTAVKPKIDPKTGEPEMVFHMPSGKWFFPVEFEIEFEPAHPNLSEPPS